jgi:hypothetical protein
MPYKREWTVFIGDTDDHLWRGTLLFSDFNLDECDLAILDAGAFVNLWRSRTVRSSFGGKQSSPANIKRQWDLFFAARILPWVKQGHTLLITVRRLRPSKW